MAPQQISDAPIRFEAVKIDPLFDLLDAVAWMDSRSVNEIAGKDPHERDPSPPRSFRSAKSGKVGYIRALLCVG